MIERLPQNPIIRADMDDRMGGNIAGPSLIRVPDWVEKPLGRYYLYFADHKGEYIRLAYADAPEGPYAMYPPGTLQLAQSGFPTEPPQLSPSQLQRMPGEDPLRPHIASPDVHVVAELREIRMNYHGLLENGFQLSRVAVSADGSDHTASRLEAELILDRWQTVLRRTPAGGFRYESTRESVTVERREIAGGAASGSLAFIPGAARVFLLSLCS